MEWIEFSEVTRVEGAHGEDNTCNRLQWDTWVAWDCLQGIRYTIGSETHLEPYTGFLVAQSNIENLVFVLAKHEV